MGIVDYAANAAWAYNHILDDDAISASNKKLIRDFADTYDVSDARKYVFYTHLKRFLLRVPDIKAFIAEPKTVNKVYAGFRKELSPSVYATLINVSKRFVRWVNDGDLPRSYRDVKTPSKKAQKRKLDPEDMVTWDEAKAMVAATNSVQIKAAIMTQLDGGLRPSEFMELTYGDVRNKPPFLLLRVKDGKTGARDVFLYHAVPYLLKWLEAHPSKKKDAPLWVKESGNKVEAYQYPALLKRLRECAKKAGVKKKLSFYNLRHSAVTLSKKDNIPTDEAADKFGHSVQHYTETYGRLDITDHLNRISQAYGLAELEGDRRENNKTCPRCDVENSPEATFCAKCGSALTLKAALEVKEENEQLRKEVEGMKDDLQKLATDMVIRALAEQQKKS